LRRGAKKRGDSLFELPISSKEIGNSFGEIHISSEEIHIFLEEIGKSPKEICISPRQIHISFLPTTQPHPLEGKWERRLASVARE